MNIPQTDISIIANAVKSLPAEAAFPSRLDDVILHQIARDLRLVQLALTEDDSIEEPPLAGPMYLVSHMMLAQTAALTGNTKLQMSEPRLRHWLQRYMYFIEKEVVARAINIADRRFDDFLMAEINADILASK